jgi:hypothetical protein
MHNVSRLAGIFACAASLAAAGCAGGTGVTPAAGSPTSAAVMSQIKGDSHTLIYMPTVRNAQHIYPQYSNAVYGNGPLLYKPKMYLIFWGFKKAGDPDGVAQLLEQFQSSIGGSTHNEIYVQYKGTKKFIKNPKNQNGSFWADDTDAIPTAPTDQQVAAESLLGVKHFGYDANGSYVVVTATGHSTPGFGTEWCAYHSAVNDTKSQLVSYTNLPYQPDAGSSCGANFISPPSDESGTDEGVTIVEGHEYGESITDPNPPTGYYSNQWGEIGDICAWNGVENDPFAKYSFTSQPMWSNATSSCVQTYSKKK